MRFFKNIGIFLSYLLVSVLFISLLWFIIYLAIPSPSKTVRTFFTAIMNEDYKRAYNLIDGKYKLKRGSLENFSNEYKQAVYGGTRTKRVRITGYKNTTIPTQKIVAVKITVLYTGSVLDTEGSYLVEKVLNKGWRIIDNVSNQENKKKPSQGSPSILPKKNP